MERVNSDEQQESSPYSWWWDSHNRPPQSQRLHSALQELDMKIKMILELIQDNGDTFAERADMYYQKRPQLIKLVQELYISYRSLADKYDQHLQSESSTKAPNQGSASNSSINSLKKVHPLLQECPGKPKPHCTTSSEEAPSSRSESDQYLETGSGLHSGKKIVNSGGRDKCSSSSEDLVISSSSCVEKEAGDDIDAMKFSQLLEEYLSQQTELIRRNDEKREVIVELRKEIKFLKTDQPNQKRRLVRGLFCMP